MRRVIGTTTLKDGGVPTSVMKVFTDKAGNWGTAKRGQIYFSYSNLSQREGYFIQA